LKRHAREDFNSMSAEAAIVEQRNGIEALEASILEISA